jgi:hypothetical protein
LHNVELWEIVFVVNIGLSYNSYNSIEGYGNPYEIIPKSILSTSHTKVGPSISPLNPNLIGFAAPLRTYK